jgi:hypothetical protein
MINVTTTNHRQILGATKSVADKMATTSVARFGKKLSACHVDHMAMYDNESNTCLICCGMTKVRCGSLRLQNMPIKQNSLLGWSVCEQ